MERCQVCNVWTEENLCPVCSSGGIVYQAWRRQLREIVAPDGIDLMGLFTGISNEVLAAQAFSAGKTPEEAYKEALQAFEDYIDAEQPEVERNLRQWRQLNAGMNVTDDGFPTPEQINL